MRRQAGRSARQAIPLLLGLVLGIPQMGDATVASDLCIGDPCVINGTHVITNFSMLDFGSAAVVLNGVLDIGPDSMEIMAGSFQVTSTGRILGQAASSADLGGTVEITTTGDILIQGTTAAGAVDLTGCGGGTLELTAGGDIVATGRLNLNRQNVCLLSGDGGFVTVFTANDVTFADIDAQGGLQATGGVVDISAIGAVSLANIDVSGGDGDGGDITVTAGGAVTLDDLNLSSGGIAGVGGTIDVVTGGPISVVGNIDALGGSGILDGDDGGTLLLDAGAVPGNDQDVTIAGRVRMNGRGDFGFGGFIQIDGRDVTVDSLIEAKGATNQAGAGIVDILATNDLFIQNRIVADAGGDGSIDLRAGRDITLSANLDLIGVNSTNGGDVLISAPQGIVTLTGSADILAQGGGGGATLGGSIRINGCEIDIGSGSTLNTSGLANGGTAAFNRLRAGQLVTIAGTLTAGGVNELFHRRPALPPSTAAGSFNPAPGVAVDPTILPCAICTGGPDTDTDGVDDSCDACIEVFDPAQTDTDRDGFGNACDCDFDNDGFCSIGDFNLFLPDFQSTVDGGTGTDMDGSGAVGISDFNLFLPGFQTGTPGPSALTP